MSVMIRVLPYSGTAIFDTDNSHNYHRQIPEKVE